MTRTSRPSLRRRLAAATASLLAGSLALAGCAAGGGGGGDQNSGGKGTLHAIFLPADWGTIVKNDLAPQYEKETGVKVDVQLIGRDAIHEKMATLFAAGDSSFDIFNVDYNWIPEFGRAGHLVPLDDVLTAEDKADFLPLALQVGTWDGQLLGVPQTIHPALLWYRADLYNDPQTQADYQAATGKQLTPPATMDDWQQQVQFFNGRTFKGTKLSGWAAQAAKGFGNVHTWLSFCYTYQCQPFNKDFTQSTLSTPEGIAATQRWADMMKFMPEGANQFTYDNVTAAAQQGTIATAIQWSWGAFAVDDAKSSKTVGDWEFTTIPTGPTGTSSSHLAEWTITVSKYSKHADAAKKFVAWLETKKNDVYQADHGGGDPVRQSSYQDPQLTEQKLPNSDVLRFRRLPVVLEAMKTAQPRPFFPLEEQWETTLSTQLSAISTGQVSVQDGLKTADQGVAQILQQ
ncbi:extracellular solute-binding protein [Georgenia sp. SYP-B2076]|uniref:extracellular solute-binding protein n=1 Tax=Georgenia sp. SYP-B2076 TaxID=2495881 RepID=UPI000F8EEAE4|nr:extracellular solute-binding protein [Georgenia sp. SYP-B2076]